MALLLDQEYKGFTCSYWLIGGVVFDRIKGSVAITLCLYKDKNQKETDINSYVTSDSLLFNTTIQVESIDQIYALILSTDKFEDAERIDD